MNASFTLLEELPYRGKRDYVHGTHLFERLRKLDPDPTHIDFLIHRQIYHQCEVSSTPVSERKSDLVATYQSDGARFHVYETDRQVTQRVPCLEEEICTQYKVNDAEIEFSQPPIINATFVESIVAAYKMILQNLHSDSKRYLFARLMVREVVESGKVQVRHQRQMGPNFFQGELRQEDELLGSIFFGLKHD
ncbi:MAG: hypothetical protein CMJ46_07385 [Planctomyces sp.]|nr:hypothetical protein [Planctomyces sp.]